MGFLNSLFGGEGRKMSRRNNLGEGLGQAIPGERDPLASEIGPAERRRELIEAKEKRMAKLEAKIGDGSLSKEEEELLEKLKKELSDLYNPN